MNVPAPIDPTARRAETRHARVDPAEEGHPAQRHRVERRGRAGSTRIAPPTRPNERRPPVLLAAPLTGLLALGACSDLETGPIAAERNAASLEIDVDPEFIFAGEEGEAFATLLDDRGQPFERLPPWVSVETSNEDVIAISGNNRFKALRPGAARLTVRTRDLEAEASVGVNPRELDYRIDAVHINQATQTLRGTVPLVAGRPGYLRVFLRGDEVNFFETDVVVRLYHDGDLVETLELGPLTRGIPEEVDADRWEGSWGAPLAGELIQPGLELVVEADPEGTIPVLGEGPVRHPSSGRRMALDVRELPPFKLTLVPVDQDRGDVPSALTPERKDDYVEPFLRMFPVGELDVRVRNRYTTSRTARSWQGWVGILEQMAALQVTEGGSRYYYGLTRRRSGSGILGLAFVGFPAGAGHDELPGADTTLAHELGHNMGLLHAPCGDPAPASVDGSYPHPDGRIGTTGVDVTLEEIRDSGMADVMSYCRPRWISPHMYERALRFRERNEPLNTADLEDPVAGSVLVFGSVFDGEARISPAFRVAAPPALPSGEGDYVLEGRDEDGRTLFRFAFVPEPIAHTGGGDGSFAFVLPPDVARPDRLHEVRVQGPGTEAVQRSTLDEAGDPRDEVHVEAEATHDGTRIEWDASRRPMVLVRDADSGEILSFAEGGTITIPGRRHEVMLDLSHGTGSVETRVPVRRR